MNKRMIGTAWEEEAARCLTENGYIILEKNFRCREGEIDLIAEEGGYLVFIEVRYRKTEAKGHPLETVNTAKQRKISRVAQYYLYKNGISLDKPVRFDVVSVLGGKIEIIKDAFSYQM